MDEARIPYPGLEDYLPSYKVIPPCCKEACPCLRALKVVNDYIATVSVSANRTEIMIETLELTDRLFVAVKAIEACHENPKVHRWAAEMAAALWERCCDRATN
jgi:hypothetical protein